MKNNQTRKINPAMSGLGILGFLGLLGFIFDEPFFHSFFAFFGFFSLYWWGKLAKEQWDERLIENQLRATNMATGICFGLIFTGMIFCGNFISSRNLALAYSILSSIVSLGFATVFNLTAFLTWKYDRED